MAEITVTMPTDVIYVAGTVNGIEKVFVQDEVNPVKWRASVASSEDDLYRISLQMYDEAGNIGSYENVIEYIMPLFVYDRTQADVDCVKELVNTGWQNMTDKQKGEWLSGLKGCLNRSDLRRIENDIYIIAKLLNVNVTTRKDNLPVYPDESYFLKLLDNVRQLRKAGSVHITTPDVPEAPINTYQKVNEIELILHDLYDTYSQSYNYFAGNEIYAGDETGLLL